MLVNVINEINKFKSNTTHNISYYITDDKSPSYDINFLKTYNIKQTPQNLGKEKHWVLWDSDLKRIKNLKNIDLIIFIPDDLSNIDFNKIIYFAEKHKYERYFFNILNDGRDICWNKLAPQKFDTEHDIIGFSDCIFFTNPNTFNKLGYHIEQINPIRFSGNKLISSGVGYQLTNRLNDNNIKIYRPKSSLAFHGDHDSKMNYDARKNIKLISKY